MLNLGVMRSTAVAVGHLSALRVMRSGKTGKLAGDWIFREHLHRRKLLLGRPCCVGPRGGAQKGCEGGCRGLELRMADDARDATLAPAVIERTVEHIWGE